jgi:hypothetical protein
MLPLVYLTSHTPHPQLAPFTQYAEEPVSCDRSHDGFTVGDQVRRRTGNKAQVGEIVAIIPAVEHPYYAAHPALARVRFTDRRHLGGNGYRHSMITLARLAPA